MRLLKIIFVMLLFCSGVSCSRGGPLTPLESFNEIKSAITNEDSETILKNLSASSKMKIDALNTMILQMNDDQIRQLSKLYNCDRSRLRNMKETDYVSLYFFVKHHGTDLGKIFSEQVVAVDVDGDTAVIRTQSGIELGFVREGPYWKLDISDL